MDNTIKYIISEYLLLEYDINDDSLDTRDYIKEQTTIINNIKHLLGLDNKYLIEILYGQYIKILKSIFKNLNPPSHYAYDEYFRFKTINIKSIYLKLHNYILKNNKIIENNPGVVLINDKDYIFLELFYSKINRITYYECEIIIKNNDLNILDIFKKNKCFPEHDIFVAHRYRNINSLTSELIKHSQEIIFIFVDFFHNNNDFMTIFFDKLLRNKKFTIAKELLIKYNLNKNLYVAYQIYNNIEPDVMVDNIENVYMELLQFFNPQNYYKEILKLNFSPELLINFYINKLNGIFHNNSVSNSMAQFGIKYD